MKRLLLVAAAALSLTGCHDFRDDLIIICDSPDKVNVPADAKTAVKLSAIGVYLDEKVKTKDGRALLEFLADANRSVRSKTLRNLAAQYEVVTCHLADMN